MSKNLEDMDAQFSKLEELIQDPEVMQNGSLYAKYLKEHGSMLKIVTKYRELKSAREELADVEEMAAKEEDPELREMAAEEAESLKEREQTLGNELQETLIGDDEEDQRNVIVEIRAGTGGDEAGLFAQDLFEMYSRFAERKRWRIEVLESQAKEIGGFKEVIFSVKGKDAYKNMKFESGGHRVQRIPATESGGRIHTSACTVAVLPEVEEVEVDIKTNDIKIDYFCASGPGGQNVNKTSSAVRITHLETGLVVSCQDTPEQHKNKMKAMRVLRSRLFQLMQEKQNEERNTLRKSQQGSGDRNERIRTYNYPQNRVTDHRTQQSIYNLASVMVGEIDEFVEKLLQCEREERLQELGSVLSA